jgi:SAM-dependent methyltransferase
LEQNRRCWDEKPLLREIYSKFYERILGLIDREIPGRILELGSGMGNLKAYLPEAITTDLFPNPWLDAACDAYELPFRAGTLSHIVLFDVFHHLHAPNAFFREARRVLSPSGRLILFEPFISWFSFPVYGLAHHEPIRWREPINISPSLTRPREYYAAQGNATRLFFDRELPHWMNGWKTFHLETFACFHYLLSGGFSKPAFYPRSFLGLFRRMDTLLSTWPRVFAGRYIIGLSPAVSNV